MIAATSLLLAAMASAAPLDIPPADLAVIGVQRPGAVVRAQHAATLEPPAPALQHVPMARPDPQSFFAWLGLCAPEDACQAQTGPAWMVATGLGRRPPERTTIDLGHDVIRHLEDLQREPELDLFRLIDDREEPPP